MDHVSPLGRRQRAGALIAVLLLHVGLIAALLTLGGSVGTLVDQGPSIETFDVALPPPPPPVLQVEEERAPREEGAAAPPNRESRATPVTAPKPTVQVPARSPVVAAPVPNEGAAPTQGAAPVAGPGSGAGGAGTGAGSGGSGSGPGGGGGGVRPALVSRSLTQRDYPRELRRRWPEGARVLVVFSVQLNGRATGCTVNRSSGDAEIDAATCRLVESKLRFRPARDEQGRPFVEKYGYMQAPVGLSARDE